MRGSISFLLSLFLLMCSVSHLFPQEKILYIKAGLLFNGRDETLQENVFITVDGDKIVSISKNPEIKPDAQIIDLSGYTVLPGLIDTHTHIVLHPGDYDEQILRETPEYRAIYGTVCAKATLESGVTTIRDMGNEGAGFADIALRDAINDGLVPGPRIFASIQPVTSTGSYNLTGYSPYFQTPPISYPADGPAEVRKTVRRLIKEGADVIKIYMESFEKKQLRQDLLTGAMNYSEEELQVLVQEAHMAGLKVAAHTYSDEAAQLAARVNVNSIEHGLYLSEATFREMAKKNIYYVPTLLVYEFWRDSKIFGQISLENKIKLTNTVEEHTNAFKRALKTNVKIAFGTDTFELPGTNAQELVLMVKYGMQPLAALKSATSVAADLVGISQIAGTIEKGKVADIIAVKGNPLNNVENILDVVFVMKDGTVYVDEYIK
jgi:imidazolonepropionase-like amidohydrolase